MVCHDVHGGAALISVVVPQNRVGGLDVLVSSLKLQTYRDFELVLVDSLEEYRALEDTDVPFPFRHVAPRDNTFPRTSYCRSVNTGIAHARGDVILLSCDYTWFHPDCLATHAELQAKHNCPVTLDYNMSHPPPVRDGLPRYVQTQPPDSVHYAAEINATTERYVADLQSGKLDPFMWSIFKEPLTDEAARALPVEHEHRPCSIREPDDYNWCSFKNESFPTELLLDMNGLDEEYDKSHTYQDSELSYRLRERGVPWVNGPPETGMVTIVNPRHIINVKHMAEPIAANYERCFGSRRAALKLPVNPGWSLRDWRRSVLG